MGFFFGPFNIIWDKNNISECFYFLNIITTYCKLGLLSFKKTWEWFLPNFLLSLSLNVYEFKVVLDYLLKPFLPPKQIQK